MSNEPSAYPVQVLVLESIPARLEQIAGHLKETGCIVETLPVHAIENLRYKVGKRGWDVAITDDAVLTEDIAQTVSTLSRILCDAPLIVVTDHPDVERACEAMRAGAHDVLDRGNLARLELVIEREISETRIRRAHRSALEAVQAREDRFRALATNIPGVVFQMQRNSSGQLNFLYVSEASLMLFGLDAEMLIGEGDRFVNMIVPEDRKNFLASMAASAARTLTLNWEGRIQLANNEIKWINVRCSPCRSDFGEALWEGVMWNITQSRQTEAELRASRAQLAELSEHLQRVKEEERDRIARDIHDVLGGTLVGIKISTSLLVGKFGNDAVLRERLQMIEAMLDDAIATTGRVARELRPGILKEFGLAAAVESYAEDFASRTGLPCHVLCADHDIETTDDTALALFRTYQETLTNVSKHAQASEVTVRLIQEGDEILLEVCDNGRGIRPADLRKPKSFGLRGIRERLNSLDGSFVIQPGSPHGTVVSLRAPIGHPKGELRAENPVYPDIQTSEPRLA